MMSRRSLIVALVLLIGVSAEATVTVRLADALEALRREGHRIVFSTDLVGAATLVELPEITLEAIERELPRIGLELRRSGDLWMIVAAPSRSTPRARPRESPSTEPTHVDEIETVIVTGSRHRLPFHADEGQLTLQGEELRLIPALGSDAMRGSTRLPGLASVGVSARPRVRGGLDDEVLVLLDGVELLDAYHGSDFQSIFSAIDDQVVDTIDVYTGGFPVRYGNRMSGVMDVHTLHPGDEPATQLGLSTTSMLANAQRALPNGFTTSMSVRRGNLDVIADRVNSRLGEPRYSDAFLNVEHDDDMGIRTKVGLLGVSDDMLIKDERDRAQSNVQSGYGWMELGVDLPGGASGRTFVSASVSDRARKGELLGSDVELEAYLDIRQTFRQLSLRTDWAVPVDVHRLELGGEVHRGDTKYDSLAFADREDLAPLTGELAPPEDHDIHRALDGSWGGVYASLDAALTDRMSLQPGVRWDVQRYGGVDRAELSPRAGIRYAIDRFTRARADVGRFRQFEAIYDVPVADGVADVAPSQYADQASIGLERADDRVAFRLELYRKRYERPKRRFENLFNPFVLLPELEPDRVELSPTEGDVCGLDAETRVVFGPTLHTVLRYGYNDADDRLNDAWVPRRWSQRHTLNAILTWHTESWAVSGAVTWHSGWRTSSPPPIIAVDETLPIETLLNNTHLEDYVSFDVSVRRSWQTGRSTITAFADLTNVFNRDNDAGIDFDEEASGDFLTFSPDPSSLLPVVPSIGVLVSF